MGQPDGRLHRSLNVTQATGIAVTLVVGAGALMLPGLAYVEVGNAAVYAWIGDALLVIPLLVTFSYLGRLIPTADGVSGFVGAGLSDWLGFATKVLMMATFIIAPPAIAVTGGRYLAQFTGSDWGKAAGLCLLFIVALAVNLAGVRIGGGVQQMLALVLTAGMMAISVAALVLGDHTAGDGVAPPSQVAGAVPALGMVFFAFVGWELLSFMAEEFENPRRDFPIAVGASFLVVLLLYIVTAVSLQLAVPRDDPGLTQAPIAVLAASFAGPTSGRIVAALGFLIIVASFTSVMWAASRLLYATAREGFLPPIFQRIDPATGVPRRAVVLTAGLFGAVTLLNATNLFSIDLLYELAGQGLFVVYGLCVVAFVRLTHGWAAKAFGIATLVPVVAVTASFGCGALYALGVIALGLIWKAVHTAKNRREPGFLPG